MYTKKQIAEVLKEIKEFYSPEYSGAGGTPLSSWIAWEREDSGGGCDCGTWADDGSRKTQLEGIIVKKSKTGYGLFSVGVLVVDSKDLVKPRGLGRALRRLQKMEALPVAWGSDGLEEVGHD